MDSNRLFAANTTLVPVLWIFPNAEDEALAKRLKASGFNLEWKVENAANQGRIFEWLAAHQRDPFRPPSIARPAARRSPDATGSK